MNSSNFKYLKFKFPCHLKSDEFIMLCTQSRVRFTV